MLSGSGFWMYLVLLLKFALIIEYPWKKCFLIPFSEASFHLCISLISSFFPSWYRMLPLPFRKLMNFVSSIKFLLKEWAQMDHHPDLHLCSRWAELKWGTDSYLSGDTCFNISFKSCYANHILLNWKMCIL